MNQTSRKDNKPNRRVCILITNVRRNKNRTAVVATGTAIVGDA